MDRERRDRNEEIMKETLRETYTQEMRESVVFGKMDGDTWVPLAQRGL